MSSNLIFTQGDYVGLFYDGDRDGVRYGHVENAKTGQSSPSRPVDSFLKHGYWQSYNQGQQMIDLPPPPPEAVEFLRTSPLDRWLNRRDEALDNNPMAGWGQPRTDMPQRDVEPAIQFQYVDDDDVAQYAYNSGFRGEDLVTIIAIGISESGLDPTGGNTPTARADAIGDVGIMDDKWDESIGIFQVRALKDPFDPRWSRPDRLRIREELFDPQFNANAAYAIFRQKRNPERGRSGFEDWTEYVNGNYEQYLDRARQAAYNVIR